MNLNSLLRLTIIEMMGKGHSKDTQKTALNALVEATVEDVYSELDTRID